MVISVLQENLYRALTQVNRIVPIKPQVPIIANILLSSEEGGIKLTATNMETSETVFVRAKVEKKGNICIPARLFLEFVSSLPQTTVHLSLDGEQLVIKAEGFHANIPGLSSGEFPSLFSDEKKNGVILKKNDVAGAINQVAFSAATDEGRPILTGIRIIQKEGGTTFAATDGFRLSVKQLQLQTKEELNFIVPARALGEVVKVCMESKEEENILLSHSGTNQLSFTVGDTEICTRLIDGEFPNFEKIIPAKHNTRVLLDKQTTLRAVKSAAIFARDNANIVRFHIENQTITVSANTPQVGGNQVEIEAKVDGEGGDMAFNSRFLIDCLANMQGDEFIFEMTGSLNPGVFKPAKDDSYLHIIMPVRVQA